MRKLRSRKTSDKTVYCSEQLGGSHPPWRPHLWATPRAPPRPHVAARAARAGGTLRLLGQGYTPVSSCAPEVPGASETPGVILCSSPLGLCGTEGIEFSYGTSSRLASISSSTTLETEGRCVLLQREWAEIPAKMELGYYTQHGVGTGGFSASQVFVTTHPVISAEIKAETI